MNQTLLLLGLLLVSACILDHAHGSNIDIEDTSGTQLKIDSGGDCPIIHQRANSGLQMSVVMNGQQCHTDQANHLAGNNQGFSGNAVAGPKNATMADYQCHTIDIADCSACHITLRFSESAPGFQGLYLRQRSGVNMHLLVNKGYCPLPDIYLKRLSNTILNIYS